MRVEVKFRDERVRAGLLALEKRRKQLTRVFRKLRVPLRQDLAEYAKNQSSPEGSWPRRAPATERRVKERASTHTFTKKHKKPKIGPRRVETSSRQMTDLLGKLPVTVSTRTRGGTAASLIAESKVPWSAIHNEGGVAGRGSQIPARPFVFFSPPFMNTAVKAIEHFMIEGWRSA